jgi:hypothetical protein
VSVRRRTHFRLFAIAHEVRVQTFGCIEILWDAKVHFVNVVFSTLHSRRAAQHDVRACGRIRLETRHQEIAESDLLNKLGTVSPMIDGRHIGFRHFYVAV